MTHSVHYLLANSPVVPAAGAAAAAAPLPVPRGPAYLHYFTDKAFAKGPIGEFLQVAAGEPTTNVEALRQIIDSQLELRTRLRSALQRWKKMTPGAHANGPDLKQPMKDKLVRVVRDEFKKDFPELSIEIGYWINDDLHALVSVEFAGTTLVICPLYWVWGDIEIQI